MEGGRVRERQRVGRDREKVDKGQRENGRERDREVPEGQRKSEGGSKIET